MTTLVFTILPMNNLHVVSVCLSFFQHGETALHFAASGGHVDMIQLLCEKGMNVNVRDKVRSIQNSLLIAIKIAIN